MVLLSQISCKTQSYNNFCNSTVKIQRQKTCEFLLPKIFLLFWRKIPLIPKSRITHMVTSNGGHPLHHHHRHSDRLSNSLFNRRTTKFQTFTQWPQASSLQFDPQWPYRPFINTLADRVQSDLTLYVLGLSRTRIIKKINDFCVNFNNNCVTSV